MYFLTASSCDLLTEKALYPSSFPPDGIEHWVGIISFTVLFVLMLAFLATLAFLCQNKVNQAKQWMMLRNGRSREIAALRSKTVVPCPKCYHALRVPVGKPLRVTCPRCRCVFDWPTSADDVIDREYNAVD